MADKQQINPDQLRAVVKTAMDAGHSAEDIKAYVAEKFNVQTLDQNKSHMSADSTPATVKFWEKHPTAANIARTGLSALPAIGGIAGGATALAGGPITLPMGMAAGAAGAGVGAGAEDALLNATGLNRKPIGFVQGAQNIITNGAMGALTPEGGGLSPTMLSHVPQGIQGVGAGLEKAGASIEKTGTAPILGAIDMLSKGVHPASLAKDAAVALAPTALRFTGTGIQAAGRGLEKLLPEAAILDRPGWQEADQVASKLLMKGPRRILTPSEVLMQENEEKFIQAEARRQGMRNAARMQE